MKRKLTAFFCAAAMLISLLAGCGSAAPETTPETQAPETQPPETTAATLAATEPTKPKTFFEEQGLTLWEGIPAEESTDSFGGEGVSGKKLIPDGIQWKFDVEWSGEGISWYELEDVNLQVSVRSYPLEAFLAEDAQAHFTTSNISNVLDSFYQADTEANGTMTKEEWLEAHQDYKILWFQCQQEMKIADTVYDFLIAEEVQERYNWHAAFISELPCIMDSADGSIYECSDDAQGIPTVLNIGNRDDAREVYAIQDWMIDWIADTTKPDGYNLTNCITSDDLIVLAPDDYDELAFVLPLVPESISAEEFDAADAEVQEKDDWGWKRSSYSEYTEGKDYCKYYFFADRMK